MNCKELITSIIDDPNQNGYSMESDDARKLIAIAYYMGRESASHEVSDQYNALLRQQIQRADECRYHRLAHYIQGDVSYLYNSDYAGDMTNTFGCDATSLTVESLKKIMEEAAKMQYSNSGMRPYAEMTIPEFVTTLKIVRNGDKCGSYHVPQSRRQEFREHLSAVKQEVMEYLTSMEEAAAEAEQERLRKIDAIPGLKELRAALDDEARYRREFNAMMDDLYNDGVRPPKAVAVSSEALMAEYPAAAAYIKAESWSYAAHDVKASAGKKALEQILAGEDPEAAISEMEKNWSDHCAANIWD